MIQDISDILIPSLQGDEIKQDINVTGTIISKNYRIALSTDRLQIFFDTEHIKMDDSVIHY